jgi:hypothetical protein
MTTPFQTLGLSNTATKEDAKKAWRTSVRDLHPDLHPKENREALNERISQINQAWDLIKKGWTPTVTGHKTQDSQNKNDLSARFTTGSEIPIFYSAKDPKLQKFLSEIWAIEEKSTKAWWFKKLAPSLVKFKLPKRDPLTILFCAAIVIENKTLTYLFQAPIPPGRVSLIVPTLSRSSSGINVRSNQPEAITLEPRTMVSGTFSPFSEEDAKNLGLDAINVSLPSRILDMSRVSKYIPETSGMRFMYNL